MAIGSHSNETTFEQWDSSCSTPTDEYSEPHDAWKHNHVKLTTGEQTSRQSRTSELLYRHTVVCMAFRNAIV